MFRTDLLSNKKVLITGGGTGLGKEIGRRFLKLGAELVICGRRREVLDTSVAELHAATGGKVTSHVCDIRNPEAVEAMMDAVWLDGPLDMLVNNAAGNFVSRTESMSHRAFDSILNIVLKGTVYCTTACGRRWIAAGRGGNILNINATTSITGQAFTVPSAVAKAGVVTLTRSLAVEWGPKGIRINAVAPGFFPTEGMMGQLHKPVTRRVPMEDEVPLRRVGKHIELTNLCAFLASDESGYINGECIVIDGGRWMQGAGGPSVRAMQDWTEDQWNAVRASSEAGR